MNRKLIFLDIDGTLTSPGSNVPPESALKAVKLAQKAGHMVFLCTGRNPAMLAPVLEYGFEGAVATAGAFVFVGDKVLFDCPMPDSDLKTAMKLFKENGVFRTIESKDASYCDDGIAEFLGKVSGGNSELMRWRKAIEKDLNILPMSQYDGRPVYKIVFMCKDRSQLGAAQEALGDRYNFVVQDAFAKSCINGELIGHSFDKGKGVRLIAEAVGADIADTIGFGDSMNDLEMIETVGVSICMENGSQLLKEKSSMVCPSVEEDGLYKAFEKLGLL